MNQDWSFHNYIVVSIESNFTAIDEFQGWTLTSLHSDRDCHLNSFKTEKKMFLSQNEGPKLKLKEPRVPGVPF